MEERRSSPSLHRHIEPLPEAALQLALRRLAWKYQRLHALRQRREEAEAQGLTGFSAEEGRERRRAFTRLAREFPGALRELEVLSAGQLRERLLQVEEAAHLVEVRVLPPWMALVLDYHRSLRQALGVKRWLARRMRGDRRLEEQVVEAFRLRNLRLRRLGLASPELEGEALRAHLELHLRPPEGRLLSLVWTELAARHGEAPSTLEARIFLSR